MRVLVRLWGALALLVLALCTSAQAQSGYDRRGDDYLKFEVKTGDPALCATRCERDARCRAWSFSYPRTASVSAMCALISQVPALEVNNFCVSGVRGAGVVEPKGPVEFSIDRLGGDYRNIEVPADSADAACKAACDGDKRCRAWTYVRPGYIGPAPGCYLKDRITRPRHKPCCISGVVR
jgi:hypothetical protein